MPVPPVEARPYAAGDRSFLMNLFRYRGRKGERWYWTVIELPANGGIAAQVIPEDRAQLCGGHESREEAVQEATTAVDAYVSVLA
jgi:hypothetical protein